MKRVLQFALVLFVFSSLFVSCTTDQFDTAIENSTVIYQQNTETTSADQDTTDPIVIPKRD